MRNIGKQLHSICVGCLQGGGKRWSGYEIWHVLCRKGGVGTWVLLFSNYINLELHIIA